MKKLCYLVLCVLLFAACQRKEATRYTLEGGDASVDFFLLQGDTLCTFYAPGHILLTCPCSVDGAGVLTVQVTGLVEAKLKPDGRRRYVGQAPFFEGAWKK